MRKHLLQGLIHPPLTEPAPAPDDAALSELAGALERSARRRLGRSLAIREVDAGSCNGCELEIHALNNAVYDLERFGIRFVASPRHADVLLVTGPVTANMQEALRRTYDATPVPIDLTIRGCPPAPRQLLQGLLALLEKSAGAA
jgi:Ni,Fe-hydrogenase III small subunit